MSSLEDVIEPLSSVKSTTAVDLDSCSIFPLFAAEASYATSPSSPTANNNTNNMPVMQYGDDLLYQYVDYLFRFKDPAMYDDYLVFNRFRTSTTTMMSLALIVTVTVLPYAFWILTNPTTPYQSSAIRIILAILAFSHVFLFWLVLYLQQGKRKKVSETTWLQALQPYSPQIETLLHVLAMAYCCMRLITRVYAGHCSSQTFLGSWDCNPAAQIYSLPLDSLLLLFIMPYILVLMMKETKVVVITMTFLAVIASIIVCINYINQPTLMSHMLIVYILLSMITFYDLQRQSYIMFIINQKLRDTLAENERIADEMHANEMRSMIANVAHDLKTPLSSFLSGVEFIGQVVIDLKSMMEQKKQLLPNDLEEFIVSIMNCIGDIKSTNSFMLMTINRCIDYTKASKGLKLVPKYETIDLYDTLLLPLNCMKDIQSRVTMHLNEIPADICSHIITDKQWLQENVLCLLSNAVKYSTDGEVTITISQRKLSKMEDQGTTDSMQYIFSGRKKLTPSNRVVPDDETMSRNRNNPDDSWGPESNDASSVAESVDTEHNSKSKTMNRKKSIASDGFILMEVEDRGIGISDEVMAGLFSPFKQAQRLAGGTGLGLYSLMKRVEALNGYCGVRGRKDGQKGSLFWFEIPYRPDRISASLHKRKTDHRVRSFSHVNPSKSNNITSRHTEGMALTSMSDDVHHALPMIMSRSKSDDQDAPGASRMTWLHKIDSVEFTPEALAKQSSILSSCSPSPKAIQSMTAKSSSDLRNTLKLKIAPPPLKILLVEDTLSILKMTTMMLRRHGHSITCAGNGEEALKRVHEQLQQHGIPFDVILMDLQMPVMDGLEAAKRLRSIEAAGLKLNGAISPQSNSTSGNSISKRASKMKYVKHMVIGVSANSDNDTTESAYQVGFDAFIAKPFSIDTFYETIEQVRENS